MGFDIRGGFIDVEIDIPRFQESKTKIMGIHETKKKRRELEETPSKKTSGKGNDALQPDAAKRNRVFISHSGPSKARRKAEDFLRDLGLDPIIAENHPTESRDLRPDTLLKLNSCWSAIILATGDDDLREGGKQPRGNVIAEVELAEQHLPGRIIYLLEEGASYPSLQKAKVWEPFTHDNMERAFAKIVRELRAFGVIGPL